MHFIGIFFTWSNLPISTSTVITVASISGYLLSLDLFGIANSIFNWKMSPLNQWKDILAHFLFFSLNACIVILIPYESAPPLNGEQSSNGSNSTTSRTNLVLDRNSLSDNLKITGWIIVVIFIAVKITNELQKVYFLYGSVRSPLYCANAPIGSKNADAINVCATVFQHVRSLVVNFFIPLLLTFYTKNLFMQDSILGEDPMPLWVETVAIIRAMRWIWQNGHAALFECAAFHLLETLCTSPLKNWTPPLRFYFFLVSRPVQLGILCLLRDRAKQIVEKVFFAVALSASSLEDRASRRTYAGCLFQANILFAPLIFVFIVVSSIISAPMLALFTLPVFFVAFPRPLRFWPGSFGLQANRDDDSAFYEQMHFGLVSSVHKANRAGRLGTLPVGSHLIARHEDRIVWIQVLEIGNNFVYYGVKGMELQETSCHSIEATRIDDIFEATFTKSSAFNPFTFHTVTPLTSVRVEMYSDTRNVLTGVIESRETLNAIAKALLKTIPWYMIKFLIKHRKSNLNNDFVEEFDDDDVQVDASTLPKSASIEALQLDEWPSSNDTSPEQQNALWASRISEKGAEIVESGTRRRSAYQKQFSTDEISDDFLLDSSRRVKGGKTRLPPINSDPGQLSQTARSDSLDSLTKKLDNIIFLPPGGVNETPRKDKVGEEAERNFERKSPSTTLETHRQDLFASDFSRSLSPPSTWIKLGIKSDPRFFPQDLISREWIQEVLYKFVTLSFSNDDIGDFLEDDALLTAYETVTRDAFCLAYGDAGVINDFYDFVGSLGPSAPVRLFRRELPPSFTSVNAPEEFLSDVLFPASRAAVKLGLDQVILGDFDDNLAAELDELDSDWYLGLDTEAGWKSAIAEEKPRLFSVDATASTSGQRSLYRSRMLALRECDVSLARLNPEAVRGLWASLNLELLYLTNDDDERYSIQAEERLLRNLTVQAADPPLGYTIFTSDPQRRGIENM